MRAIILLSIILVMALKVSGQNKKKASAFQAKTRAQNQFLEKQWWLGFKSGINLSSADPTKRYTILTPTNYPSNQTDKTYNQYTKAGMITTLEATFYYKGFSFSFQPTYRNSFFTYSNQFQWRNPENSNELLQQEYTQEQKLEFVDFPILVKYEFLHGNLRPFAQAGLAYSFLVNGIRKVKVTSTDIASGGTNQWVSEPVIVGTKDLFENNWSLALGGGASYQLGNIRVILDASYRLGLSNLTNTKNRYLSDRLSGIGDVQDDIHLKNIVVTAGVLFPLRFLSNSFKSNDH